MSLKNRLYIFGYSGHAYVVLDTAISMDLALGGYFDVEERVSNPYNLKYLGSELGYDFNSIRSNALFFPAMGSNRLRTELLSFLESKSLKLATLVHNRASVSNYSNIGMGTLVGPGAILNSLSRVGKGCIINSGVVIEHECTIGDLTHIAPGCVLAGNVKVGKNCFIGANAIIKEGITIADNVIVGAGSVVLENLNANQTWAGNPAKKIR